MILIFYTTQDLSETAATEGREGLRKFCFYLIYIYIEISLCDFLSYSFIYFQVIIAVVVDN